MNGKKKIFVEITREKLYTDKTFVLLETAFINIGLRYRAVKVTLGRVFVASVRRSLFRYNGF